LIIYFIIVYSKLLYFYLFLNEGKPCPDSACIELSIIEKIDTYFKNIKIYP